MKTSEILHFAFRARDPVALGRWPDKALCPPEHIDAALAQVLAGFAELTKNPGPGDGVPLLLLEKHMQQQQQQQ